MIDVLTAYTALAIPEVAKKIKRKKRESETFVPNKNQEGIFRNDDFEVKLSIIFCIEF